MPILVTMTFENAEDVSRAMDRLATTGQFAAQQDCGNPTVAADAARLHVLLDDHPHPGMRDEVRELLGHLHEYSYASACRAIDAIAARLVPPPPAGTLSMAAQDDGDAARFLFLTDERLDPDSKFRVRDLLSEVHRLTRETVRSEIDLIAARASSALGNPPAAPSSARRLSVAEWVEETRRPLADRPVIDPADRPDTGFPLPPVFVGPCGLPKTEFLSPDTGFPLPPVALPATATVGEWASATSSPAEVFGGPPALPALPALPPVPAPPAAASSPPSAATAPTGAPAFDLDKDGMPWDSRLHAGTRTKNADGTWRALRKPAAPKVDVEADLKAGLAAPPAAVPPPSGTVGENFAQYMARIGPLFAADAGKATAAMAAALAPCGLAHIGQLAARADLIPEVDARFQAGMAA